MAISAVISRDLILTCIGCTTHVIRDHFGLRLTAGRKLRDCAFFPIPKTHKLLLPPLMGFFKAFWTARYAHLPCHLSHDLCPYERTNIYMWFSPEQIHTRVSNFFRKPPGYGGRGITDPSSQRAPIADCIRSTRNSSSWALACELWTRDN